MIGKAHRLGLQARPSPVKPNEPEAKPVVVAAPEPEPVLVPEVPAVSSRPPIRLDDPESTAFVAVSIAAEPESEVESAEAAAALVRPQLDDWQRRWADGPAAVSRQTGEQIAALRRGDVAITWSTEQAGDRRDEGIFAFERDSGDDKVLVVLNASAGASEACAPASDGGACMQTSFAAGTTLVDVAPDGAGDTFTVGAGGAVTVAVPARSGRVLVAQ